MDYLFLNLPICKLKNNKFNIPNNVNKIWIDVGTSFNSPNSIQFLNRNSNGFVIGFEPDPNNYITQYSIHNFKKNLWLLNNEDESALKEKTKRQLSQKRDIFNNTEEYLETNSYMNKYILIPCAIGLEEGYKSLYLNSHHGSSSLNENWSGCDSNNNIQVLVKPLKNFINMIPDKYNYIEHLKIDTESLDLDVLLSAGNTIERIAIITVEDEKCHTYLIDNNFEFLEKQNGGFSYINKKYKSLLNNLDYFIRV
jgi:FkbM family methyltransferase